MDKVSLLKYLQLRMIKFNPKGYRIGSAKLPARKMKMTLICICNFSNFSNNYL